MIDVTSSPYLPIHIRRWNDEGYTTQTLFISRHESQYLNAITLDMSSNVSLFKTNITIEKNYDPLKFTKTYKSDPTDLKQTFVRLDDNDQPSAPILVMDSKIETTKCNFTIDRKIRYYKHNLFNIYTNISNLISQLQYKFGVTDEMNIIKKGTGKHLTHTRNPMAKNEICRFDIDGNIIKGEHEFNNTDII
jgi:hypothetical protein